MNTLEQRFTLTVAEAAMVVNGLQMVMAQGGGVTQETDQTTVVVTTPADNSPTAECIVTIQRNPIVLTRKTFKIHPDSARNN